MGGSQVLSDDDVRCYRSNGFMVPEYRLPDELLRRLQAATQQLITDRPDLIDEPIVGPHLPGGGKHGLYADRAFLDVATDPGLLDIVERLTAPDLILMNALMFYKRAEQGPKVPWHRDGFALPIEPMGGTSVWIAVTESTTANGCLRFIPGSHLSTNPGTHDPRAATQPHSCQINRRAREGGGTVFLGRELPPALGREVSFTGSPLSAERACETGFLNYVVDSENPLS